MVPERSKEKRYDVLIIGAGAAGLIAARTLAHAGVPSLILEARNRLGGRIWTVGGRSSVAELGAEFIHGRPDATWDLIRDLNLTAYDIPFEHIERHGRGFRSIKDYQGRMAMALNGMSRLGKDRSFAEYLRRRERRAENKVAMRAAAQTALDFVTGFDAADPERVSARSLSKEQETLGDVSEEPQFRILGGYGRLVRRMLAPGTARVRLNTRVREIRWSGADVVVHCETGRAGQGFVARAHRAIVTVPLGVLQQPPEAPGAVRFVPELPEKRRAMALVASGPVIKAVLTFREPVWRCPGLSKSAADRLRDASFVHDPRNPFPTWWTPRPMRSPMLTAWAGGPRARVLSGLGATAMRREVIRSLGRLLGCEPAAILALGARVHVHDWPSDPFSLGAYSYEAVGGAHARRVLARPEGRCLFFAGEATDTQGQASTVAGALASGKRAVREVLKSL